MTDRPIIFSGPMVRAILEGRKTQTRRIQPSVLYGPRYDTGDRLWVRETWGWQEEDRGDAYGSKRVVYRADGKEHPTDNGTVAPWKPSIFMPRHASRLTLIVTDVRVERLQEISEADAIAEGVRDIPMIDLPRQATWNNIQDFSQIWDSINSKREGASWEANPWVVAVTFMVVKANIDAIGRQQEAAE